MNSTTTNIVALVDSAHCDMSLILATDTFDLFATGSVAEMREHLKEIERAVLVVDTALAGQSIAAILDLFSEIRTNSYAIFLGHGTGFAEILAGRDFTNCEFVPKECSGEDILFFVKKANAQLAYQRSLSDGALAKVASLRANIQSLEAKVFDSFTLNKLGKSMLAMQDMDKISNVLLTTALESCGALGGALFLLNPTSARYELCALRGISDPLAKELFFAPDEGLFFQVLKGGEPFSIRNAEGSYRFVSMVEKWNLESLDSNTWFPLTVKNQLIGALALCAKSDSTPYSEVEQGFIAHLADQGAVALESVVSDREKVKVQEVLSRKVRSLSVLYDVSQALNFANNLKKILLLILDKAKESVEAQKGSIMLLDPHTDMLEVSVVLGIDPLEEAKINSGQMECTKLKVGEGIAGKVAQTKQPYILNKAKESTEFLHSDKSNVDSIICMPLIANDEVIGVMNITNKTSGAAFGGEDIEFLSTLSGQAAITIYNAKLYNLAITDGLTKLYIRRYFAQKLEEELSRARRYKRSLAIVMSDIDHFKRFNDTYGHQQGDRVLVQVADIFRAGVRDVDLPCRYGGEEFVLVLPETSGDRAQVVAERLRMAIASHEFPGDEQSLGVSVSLGIASFPEDGDTPAEIIKAADTALYYSKQTGRNKVTLFTEGMSMRPNE